MSYKCPLCEIDPLNHSLTKLKETDKILIFYSCPSQAKLYFDCNGIINHYSGVLREIPENKKWIWIFDSKGFNFNHFIQINVGIELSKLILNKFSHNLLSIVIINKTNYVSLTHNLLTPFIGEKINKIITFNDNIKTINDIINYFEYESENIN
jgi:hypothetical protein